MTDTRPMIISCTGKESYDSKAHAIKARKMRIERAKGMRNSHKEKKREVTPLQPYRCDRCHHWHLGTRRNGTRQI